MLFKGAAEFVSLMLFEQSLQGTSRFVGWILEHDGIENASHDEMIRLFNNESNALILIQYYIAVGRLRTSLAF